jgi:hypothetical protein
VGAVLMSRRYRRAHSRREQRRIVREKTGKFFELHQRGLSQEAIATALNLTVADVGRMIDVVDEAKAKAREKESTT